MEQQVRELSKEMIERLEKQRSWVRDHFINDASQEYEKFEEKIKLLDVILTSNWINNDETYKLQCLGITFGDALVQYLQFKWIEVEDDFGIDPAIKYGTTSLILFPLTMISKRIENNEEVNIYDLYHKVKMKVLELRDTVDKK
jgi:hypothetical protein